MTSRKLQFFWLPPPPSRSYVLCRMYLRQNGHLVIKWWLGCWSSNQTTIRKADRCIQLNLWLNLWIKSWLSNTLLNLYTDLHFTSVSNVSGGWNTERVLFRTKWEPFCLKPLEIRKKWQPFGPKPLEIWTMGAILFGFQMDCLRMVRTMAIARPFQNQTIGNLNFKTFGIPMYVNLAHPKKYFLVK